MKTQPIKLITTLTRRELRQLNENGHSWVVSLLNKQLVMPVGDTFSENFVSYITETSSIVFQKRKEGFNSSKTYLLNNGYVRLVNNFLEKKSKVISHFSSNLENIPEILKQQFLTGLYNQKKNIKVGLQKIFSFDKLIDFEKITLESSKGTGTITRDKSKLVARVFNQNDELIYLGGGHTAYPRHFDDLKKDIITLL